MFDQNKSDGEMCFHVFANLHTYRGMVTARHLERPADAENVGDAYWFTFGIRLFNPIAQATLACPLRGKAWALDSFSCDFRAAQNEAAMVPREGPWYSSCEDNLHGVTKLTSPLYGATLALPGEIFITSRVSWTPAHLVIRFEHANVLQKISFRPAQGEVSVWHDTKFAGDVFPREIQLAHPLMFFIPSEIPADAAQPSFDPNPPSSNESPASSEWDWSTNDWDWHTNDWSTAPNQGHGKQEEASESKKTNNDWEEWKAWHGYGNNPAPDPELAQEVKTTSNDASTANRTQEATPVPEDVGTAVTSINPAPVDPEVKAAEPEASNDTATVKSIGRPSTNRLTSVASQSRFQEDFLALQALAATGKPTSLEDRYSRQVYANRLSLTPALYNMLVFGEAPAEK